MNRIGIAALAVLLMAAGVRSAAFSEQLADWRKKASEQRDKLKWDRKKIYARYPTPELQLVSSAPSLAAPGETLVVKAKGKVPQGSLVLFDCPELEVVSLKSTPRSVDAKVKVVAPLFSPPNECRLAAYAPVSSAGAFIPAVVIRAEYAWSLKLSNGLSVDVSYKQDPAGTLTAHWRDGDKDVGERTLSLPDGAPAADKPLRLAFGRTPEDNNVTSEKWTADPMYQQSAGVTGEKHKAIQAMSQQCIAEAGGPVRLDEKKMRACEKQRGDEINRSFAAREQPFRQREGELRREHPAACNEVVLDPGGPGKVTGLARDCRGQGATEVKVEGTLVVRRLSP